MKENLIIADIDGCIADCRHRLYHIVEAGGRRRSNPDWNAFLSKCVGDKPIKPVINVLNGLFEAGFYVAYVTGREDPYRLHTEKWLSANNVNYDLLIMRKKYDRRHDRFMKIEAFELLTSRNAFKSVVVFDDRDSVIKAFREIGVTAVQVADSSY